MTADPDPATDPDRVLAWTEGITFTYTKNDDGWVTAQVVEMPAAISQGLNRQEAFANVIGALHDLLTQPEPKSSEPQDPPTLRFSG